MVALSTSNYQHLKDIEGKLATLKPHLIGNSPLKKILETKLRELEAERQLLGRRSSRTGAA